MKSSLVSMRKLCSAGSVFHTRPCSLRLRMCPSPSIIHQQKGCLPILQTLNFSNYTNNNEDDGTKPKKSRRNYRSGFIDSLRIHVKAGMGGQGLPTKGGNGGRGGDIVIVGSKKTVLQDIEKKVPTKRFSAPTGADSKFFCLYGDNGKSVQVSVPLGITAISEQGQKIGEINKPGDKLVVAKGGAGGCASNGFSAQKGQTHSVTLDLKLIADVGFVGFPNAGKSTLLKALSKASPKIASYPFTTVRPNVGVIEYEDFRKISLADLPGLVEGAHANVGMGHKFLKHVERTKLLLFVVDLHGFQLGPNFPLRNALETIILLNKELELYDPNLMEKPVILALNKSDLANSYGVIENVRNTFSSQEALHKFVSTLPKEFIPESLVKFDKIVSISAAKDPNSVGMLKKIIRQQLDINDDYDELVVTKSKEYVHT
jgi:Obg family GTPase CgtA